MQERLPITFGTEGGEIVIDHETKSIVYNPEPMLISARPNVIIPFQNLYKVRIVGSLLREFLHRSAGTDYCIELQFKNKDQIEIIKFIPVKYRFNLNTFVDKLQKLIDENAHELPLEVKGMEGLAEYNSQHDKASKIMGILLIFVIFLCFAIMCIGLIVGVITRA